MKNLSSLAAGVIALGVVSSPALAANRTFVSGAGADTGICAIAAPCRTFAYALTQTAPSGEIIVLSSGGYGSVIIHQAVSIINSSNYAGITVASGNGITIAAGASDSVVLRGLSIDGGGTGANGIVFNSGSSLTIDQCNVVNFVGTGTTGNGVLMQPASGSSRILITNTTASNNGYVGAYYLPPSGSTASTAIVIDRVTATNSYLGMFFDNSGSSGAATVYVSNSIATGNTYAGYDFYNVTASMDSSYAYGSQYGVFAGPGTFALGRSVLMNNTIGLANNGNSISSYKDNRIAENGTQISGQAPVTATLY